MTEKSTGEKPATEKGKGRRVTLASVAQAAACRYPPYPR